MIDDIRDQWSNLDDYVNQFINEKNKEELNIYRDTYRNYLIDYSSVIVDFLTVNDIEGLNTLRLKINNLNKKASDFIESNNKVYQSMINIFKQDQTPSRGKTGTLLSLKDRLTNMSFDDKIEGSLIDYRNNTALIKINSMMEYLEEKEIIMNDKLIEEMQRIINDHSELTDGVLPYLANSFDFIITKIHQSNLDDLLQVQQLISSTLKFKKENTITIEGIKDPIETFLEFIKGKNRDLMVKKVAFILKEQRTKTYESVSLKVINKLAHDLIDQSKDEDITNIDSISKVLDYATKLIKIPYEKIDFNEINNNLETLELPEKFKAIFVDLISRVQLNHLLLEFEYLTKDLGPKRTRASIFKEPMDYVRQSLTYAFPYAQAKTHLQALHIAVDEVEQKLDSMTKDLLKRTLQYEIKLIKDKNKKDSGASKGFMTKEEHKEIQDFFVEYKDNKAINTASIFVRDLSNQYVIYPEQIYQNYQFNSIRGGCVFLTKFKDITQAEIASLKIKNMAFIRVQTVLGLNKIYLVDGPNELLYDVTPDENNMTEFDKIHSQLKSHNLYINSDINPKKNELKNTIKWNTNNNENMFFIYDENGDIFSTERIGCGFYIADHTNHAAIVASEKKGYILNYDDEGKLLSLEFLQNNNITIITADPSKLSRIEYDFAPRLYLRDIGDTAIQHVGILDHLPILLKQGNKYWYAKSQNELTPCNNQGVLSINKADLSFKVQTDVLVLTNDLSIEILTKYGKSIQECSSIDNLSLEQIQAIERHSGDVYDEREKQIYEIMSKKSVGFRGRTNLSPRERSQIVEPKLRELKITDAEQLLLKVGPLSEKKDIDVKHTALTVQFEKEIEKLNGTIKPGDIDESWLIPIKEAATLLNAYILKCWGAYSEDYADSDRRVFIDEQKHLIEMQARIISVLKTANTGRATA